MHFGVIKLAGLVLYNLKNKQYLYFCCSVFNLVLYFRVCGGPKQEHLWQRRGVRVSGWLAGNREGRGKRWTW